jgi:hypothetical protein
LPPKQRALFLRRWLSAQDGEAPSPVQAACWVDVKRKYLELRPHLRRVYLAVHDLEPYAAAAVKLGFRVLAEPGADGWRSAARELVFNGHRIGLTRLEFGVMEFLQANVTS